jgi:hypothetical protein
MFAEKDKEDRRRLLMMQPKRASGRLEIKRREQEDKDRELAMKVSSAYLLCQIIQDGLGCTM